MNVWLHYDTYTTVGGGGINANAKSLHPHSLLLTRLTGKLRSLSRAYIILILDFSNCENHVRLMTGSWDQLFSVLKPVEKTEQKLVRG